MKKILYLVMLPLFIGCGNTAPKTISQAEADSLAVIEGVDSVVVEDVDVVSASDSYSTQGSDVVKEFDVEADVYKVNTTTMEMSYRGKEDLHVTLYTNHTAYAVGREGASMQVYESTERGYDFMCNVYGNKYIYFFSTDEIQ